MTVLNNYSTPTEAYIDKGFLKNHGIPAEIEEGAMSEIFPAPGSGQGISLSVPDDLADKARRLLDSRQDCPGPVDRLNE